jgi:hypothetical protein
LSTAPEPRPASEGQTDIEAALARYAGEVIAAAGATAEGMQRHLAVVRQVEADALAMAANDPDPERRAGAQKFADLARHVAGEFEAALQKVREVGGFEGAA